MDDLNQEAKLKVLEQIMQLMDDHMAGDLKPKSPNTAVMEMHMRKPSDDMSAMNQDADKSDALSDLKDKADMMPDSDDDEKQDDMSDDDLSDEDREKLQELYERYK